MLCAMPYKRRSGNAQLLLKHGADLKSVSLIDALRSWDQRINRFFLDNGGDPIGGSPFAVAFSESNALPGRLSITGQNTPSLQRNCKAQLDAALRTVCDKQDSRKAQLQQSRRGEMQRRIRVSS
jgi:hypothetical protein